MSERSLRALDIIGLAAGAGGLIGMAAFFCGVAPRFDQMFHDLGGPLPTLTRLCLNPWPWIGVSLLPPLVVADGMARRVSARGRAVRLCLAVLLLLAAVAVLWVGLYLPLFRLEHNVQASIPAWRNHVSASRNAASSDEHV